MASRSRDTINDHGELGHCTMSLQIRKIVLYGLTGQVRQLELRLGALNILTGASKTGKSAIIDIIDYCTGRDECYVAEGIQRHVAWFGILFEDSGTQIFVARRSPGGINRTSGDIYVEQGVDLIIPAMEAIDKNDSVDGVESLLSRAVGIRENRHVGRPNQTRPPLQANFRHALLLCLQDQNDIDNRIYLFHRQAETYTAVDIRHTLPYFLGAIDEDRLLKQAQLEAARRELRQLERRQRSAETVDSVEYPRAQSLLAEAALVGLTDSTAAAEGLGSALDALRTVPTDDFLRTVGHVGSGEEQIEVLRRNRQNLRAQLTRIREGMREAHLFTMEKNGYEREAREHRARLSSIELIQNTNGSNDLCPLCEHALSIPIPSIEQIRRSLAEINIQLQSAEMESPRIEAHLIQLSEQEQTLVGLLRDNQERITSLYRESELLSQQHDEAILQARVIGKITQYLETVSEGEYGSDLLHQIEEARRSVELLESELDPDIVHENADTFLSFVSDYMTEFARRLSLEYSENRVRLDIRRLTVVADTMNGPVTMERMGSGENWVGYHVVSHLALHRWFRTKRRPVPGFLIFDQPSQAHYPPTKTRTDRLRSWRTKIRLLSRICFD